MNTDGQKVQIARINRKLADDGERLVTTRNASDIGSMGEHYIINIVGNYVIHTHIDLDDLDGDLFEGCAPAAAVA